MFPILFIVPAVFPQFLNILSSPYHRFLPAFTWNLLGNSYLLSSLTLNVTFSETSSLIHTSVFYISPVPYASHFNNFLHVRPLHEI